MDQDHEDCGGRRRARLVGVLSPTDGSASGADGGLGGRRRDDPGVRRDLPAWPAPNSGGLLFSLPVRGAHESEDADQGDERVIPACAGSALPDLQISRGMFGSVAASVPTHRPFSAAEWMSLLLGLGWPQADRIRGLFKFGEAAIAQPPPGCLLLGNRRLAAPILASDRAPPGGHDPSRT